LFRFHYLGEKAYFLFWKFKTESYAGKKTSRGLSIVTPISPVTTLLAEYGALLAEYGACRSAKSTSDRKN